jgi:tRNA pseudouridine38-40 synthase
MRNLRLELEYDGTHYCGWQVQGRNSGRKRSIQEALEKTLRIILNEKIRTIVSGRTDAGVHALGQVANFRVKSNIPLHRLKYALNCLLPKDISVNDIKEVSATFHSRFRARSKTYRYAILNREHPSALSRNTAYFYPYPLNLSFMRREARCLIGSHDFKSFQAADKKERGSVRTIKKINIAKRGDFVYIDIQADGFLYNMARNIAGTLIKIARGKAERGSLKNILDSRDRKYAGPTAPAKGLTLLKVYY